MPPTTGTRNASHGLSVSRADSRSPGARWKNISCSRSTVSPMTATTRPAIAPTTAASPIRLDSRARTSARRRRGISSRAAASAIKAHHRRNRANSSLVDLSNPPGATIMPYPVRGILAAGAAVLVSLTTIPIFAQTGTGLLEGTAAFGDWHTDRPGTRRLIRPQDLPAPDLNQSARNSVRTVRRTDDQKPIVPNGFEVNLFASGLLSPRILRLAPNGDMFVAESSAGQIRVLRAERQRRAGRQRSSHPACVTRSESRSIRPDPTRNGSISAIPIPSSASPIRMATRPRAAPPRPSSRICRSAATARATWRSRRTARPCMSRSAPAPMSLKAWRR